MFLEEEDLDYHLGHTSQAQKKVGGLHSDGTKDRA